MCFDVDDRIIMSCACKVSFILYFSYIDICFCNVDLFNVPYFLRTFSNHIVPRMNKMLIASARPSVKSLYQNTIFLFFNQNICCGYSKEPSQ